MEKVINFLCDIEEKANRILDRASEEKIQLHEQLQKDLNNLDADIKNDTQGKIHAMQGKMNQEFEQERQNLIDASEENLKSLETNFNANQEAFVNKVIKNIIGE